jgi:hypothetical protein
MRFHLRLIVQNVFGAVCFFLDYRTGIAGAGGLLVVVFCISAVRETLRSRRFTLVLGQSFPYLLWLLASVTSGVLFSVLAKEQSVKIIDAAVMYKAKTGQYPQSLRDLTEYASSLDKWAILHIGSSQVFLYAGTVTYLRFPGQWVNYNLESKHQSETEVW